VDIKQLLNAVAREVELPIVTLLLVVALIVFFFGVFEFLRDLDSEDERRKGIQHMIWGIVGLTVMVSALGIVTVIKNLIGVS
jgi:uncharacterized membrane protein YidH (DUF202 family)